MMPAQPKKHARSIRDIFKIASQSSFILIMSLKGRQTTSQRRMFMEGNGRRLAWVAIALSVIALIVSVGNRAQSRWQGYNDPRGFYSAPAAPQGQFGPQGGFGHRGQFGQQGPQGQVGPQGQGQFGPQGQFDRWGPMGREFGPPWNRGRMPFFLFPLMLIGGLLKLLFVGFLIWLGIRLIKGRGFGPPWGRGPGGRHEHGEQARPPDPEQPPYTGETQQM
jgi:hypothetical protein